MMKVGVAGCSGRMGQSILQGILKHPSLSLVGGSVRASSESLGKDLGLLAGMDACGMKATSDLDKAFIDAQVIIDFTLPDVAIQTLDYYQTHRKKVVFGGTGFSDEQIELIVQAAQNIAVVHGSNMSIGINLCYQLAAKAARVLKNFDIDIFEAHHRHKIDAPSGTALAFGEHIAKARELELKDVAQFDRHSKTVKRAKDEIGFSSMRGGDIFGEHTVYYASDSERVEIVHRASSREAFSQGAILAAMWLQDKANGFYGMSDVLDL